MTASALPPLGRRLQLAESLLGVLQDSSASLQKLLAEVHREVGLAVREEVEAARDERIGALTREVEQLREGLASRGVIERAKGMLMQARNLTESDAFDLLTGMSRQQRRKLRDVAADVAAGTLPPQLVAVADPGAALLQEGATGR